MVLVDCYKKWEWLEKAAYKRLQEEFGKLKVEMNVEKTRIIDLERKESFKFLGFEFRQIKTLKGKSAAYYTPKKEARKALLTKLKGIFKSHKSQPVKGIVDRINPILRGWVNYYRVGHSSRCFSYVQRWVEKKIRRHLMHASKRKGFGWKRWSTEWIYTYLGLYQDYQIRYNYKT